MSGAIKYGVGETPRSRPPWSPDKGTKLAAAVADEEAVVCSDPDVQCARRRHLRAVRTAFQIHTAITDKDAAGFLRFAMWCWDEGWRTAKE